VGQLRCSWDVATIGRCPRARADQLVVGDLAYEGGIESGDAMLTGQHVSFEYRVTNIYRREAREGGEIVHHYSDISPAIQDVRECLQPPTGEASLSFPERMWKYDAILTGPTESDGL
jgi:hypothetical protein